MNTRINLLLIEDSDDDALLIVKEIRARGLEPEWERVQDADGLKAALERKAWDIVLCDYGLPGFDPLTAMRMVKAIGYDTPVILVSGSIGEEIAVEAIKDGADDYILKDKLQRLVPAIKRELHAAELRREKRRADAILRESEVLLNAIQHLTKIGGWEWNVEKQTMFWTEELYHIHDFEPGEFVPGSAEHIARSLNCYDPQDRPAIQETFQRCANEGKPYDLEFPFTTAKGRRLWIRTMASPILEDGRIIRVTGNVMDITERKQAEAQRENLFHEVEEKNLELEQMVYIASHDLRSPLLNIMGFSWELQRISERLKEGAPGEGGPEALLAAVKNDIPRSVDYILASANKMEALLDGLLKLSRIGRLPYEPKILYMNEMMTKVAATFQFMISKKSVRMDIAQLPACRGDEAQVNQVFSNLISNALNYLDPSRPGVIKLTGERRGKESIYCVEDNGIGIAPEHQKHIFETYHRLNPNDSEGEGLGLTIVKKITEKHGGKIWLESEEGAGSRFYVSLPAE